MSIIIDIIKLITHNEEMKIIISLIISLFLTVNAFGANQLKILNFKEVKSLIEKNCNRISRITISSDTYFSYECNNVFFYVFKQKKLSGDKVQNYRMIAIDPLTREPLALIKKDDQTISSQHIIDKYDSMQKKSKKK